MSRNSPLGRALLRVRGVSSADDRDVERVLRAISAPGRRDSEPMAVHIAGEPLEEEDYADWRERKLRRGALTPAPELAPWR